MGHSSRIVQGLFYAPRMTPPYGIYQDDRQEYLFGAFLKELCQRAGKPLQDVVYQHSDHAVNDMIQNYGLVVVMLDHEGNKICYSFQPYPKLPQEFIDRVRSTLRIMPSDDILWSADVFTTPQPGSAREIIFGERLPRQTKRAQRQKQAMKWQHPDTLSAQELDFLMGRENKPPTD